MNTGAAATVQGNATKHVTQAKAWGTWPGPNNKYVSSE